MDVRDMESQSSKSYMAMEADEKEAGVRGRVARRRVGVCASLT